MAAKKKKKIVKRTASKSKSVSKAKKLYGMDHDFVIISGGGLVVILLALYFIYR